MLSPGSGSEEADESNVQARSVQCGVNAATGGWLGGGFWSLVIVKVSVSVPPDARAKDPWRVSWVADTSSTPQVGFWFRPEATAK